MPRDNTDIGSQGLEQGGANLGNDISRPIGSDSSTLSTRPDTGNITPENREKENASNNSNINEEDAGDGSMPDPETLSKEEPE